MSYNHFCIAEVETCHVRWGGTWVECSQQARLFREFDAFVAWWVHDMIHALALIHLEIWESSPNQGIRVIALFGGDLAGIEVLKYWQLFLSPDHLFSIGRFRAVPTYPIISYYHILSRFIIKPWG